jgi:uncharacterized protein
MTVGIEHAEVELREVQAYSALMITQISTMADAAKLASTGRIESGRLQLATLPRLDGLLVQPFGDVNFQLEFFADIAQRPCVRLQLKGTAHLLCQRSLEGFAFPLESETQLGFIAEEADESALMPGFDPILITLEAISFQSIVEDELILMIPQVPVNPALTNADEPSMWQAKPPEKTSPFANLSSLLKEKPAEKS